jgi:sugar/nucleoside kinase (ribokinase family)
VDLVGAAIDALRHLQRTAWLSITAGMDGSWAWDGRTLAHAPAHRVQVASTAGAGDAHFAGLLAGLATGLALSEAQELAALVAALSVTSPHTINKEISRMSLGTFAGAQPTRPSPAVCLMLGLA